MLDDWGCRVGVNVGRNHETHCAINSEFTFGNVKGGTGALKDAVVIFLLGHDSNGRSLRSRICVNSGKVQTDQCLGGYIKGFLMKQADRAVISCRILESRFKAIFSGHTS